MESMVVKSRKAVIMQIGAAFLCGAAFYMSGMQKGLRRLAFVYSLIL